MGEMRGFRGLGFRDIEGSRFWDMVQTLGSPMRRVWILGCGVRVAREDDDHVEEGFRI